MFGKKSAIKKYIKRLPAELSKRYGRSNKYTEGQVKTTVQDLGLNKKYIGYAYLMFCGQIVADELTPLEEAMLRKIQKVVGIAAGPEGFAELSAHPIFHMGEGADCAGE